MTSPIEPNWNPISGDVYKRQIYSPSTFAELDISLKQALYDAAGIAVVRYPKGGELPGCEGFQPDYKPYTLSLIHIFLTN